jgi:transcription elongation factor Elf1
VHHHPGSGRGTGLGAGVVMIGFEPSRTDSTAAPAAPREPREKAPTTARRRRPSGTRSTASGVVEPSVTCVSCQERIAASSFVEGDHHRRTASCANCGLVVSVTAASWARQCEVDAAVVVERSLGERLRARRIARATESIRAQVALSSEDGIPS